MEIEIRGLYGGEGKRITASVVKKTSVNKNESQKGSNRGNSGIKKEQNKKMENIENGEDINNNNSENIENR